MINAWWEPLDFTIQEGADWSRVVDTSLPPPRISPMPPSR